MKDPALRYGPRLERVAAPVYLQVRALELLLAIIDLAAWWDTDLSMVDRRDDDERSSDAE